MNNCKAKIDSDPHFRSVCQIEPLYHPVDERDRNASEEKEVSPIDAIGHVGVISWRYWFRLCMFEISRNDLEAGVSFWIYGHVCNMIIKVLPPIFTEGF